MKKYSNLNVYEASMKRLDFIFDEFDSILIPFSGGKDSSLILNLIIDYLKENPKNNKISIYHFDYELQYQQTTDYIHKMIEEMKRHINIDFYYICLPFISQCGVSASQTYWRPWEESKKDLWIRELPQNSINIYNHKFDFWNKNLLDYDFNMLFAKWISDKNRAKKSIIMSGLRVGEFINSQDISLNQKSMYKDKQYIKNVMDNLYIAYPIYDFTMQDIWTAYINLNYKYNPIYDLFFQLGVCVDELKEASSFNNNLIGLLKYLKVIDIDMWEKAVKRVGGVEFGARYANTQAFYTILPKNHSWNSYLNFLLSTSSDEVRENFISKFQFITSLERPINSQMMCKIILENSFNRRYISK